MEQKLQTTQPTSSGAVTVVTNYCANCVKPSHPQQCGPDLPFFWQAGPAHDPHLLTKSGDGETNPGPTTLNKRVWICDICYKQIHVRKQISIRCNRIKQWMHLRCAGIRQAQYTDTCTCHLHRESRLTMHTAITPPHPSRPWSMPHHRMQNTDTRPTLPRFPQDW